MIILAFICHSIASSGSVKHRIEEKMHNLVSKMLQCISKLLCWSGDLSELQSLRSVVCLACEVYTLEQSHSWQWPGAVNRAACNFDVVVWVWEHSPVVWVSAPFANSRAFNLSFHVTVECRHDLCWFKRYSVRWEEIAVRIIVFLKKTGWTFLRFVKMNLKSIINNKYFYIINTLCIISYGCNQVNFIFNLAIQLKKFNIPKSLSSFCNCMFWLEKPAVFMATKILSAAQNQPRVICSHWILWILPCLRP